MLMVTISSRLTFAGLMVLGACAVPTAPPQTTSTPVILISLDTLRADRLGTYGYTQRPTSPNIDALARDAVVFEQHQSTAPWTTPAHLSLMSGLYPAHHGVLQPYFAQAEALENGGEVDALPEERVTIAELLEGQGYSTAAFTGGGAVDPAVGLGQGFSRYDTDHYKLTDAHLQGLDTWLGEVDSKPFFLFWHTFEVHAPYTDTRFLTPEQLSSPAAHNQLRQELSKLDGLLRQRRPSASQQVKAHDGMRSILHRNQANRADVTSTLYDGGIAAADSRLGELIAILKRRGLYSDSLIIVTSDHGDEFTDHNPYFYDAHGHSVYEEMVHTPLIVKLPGQANGGMRISSRVSAVDVLPTISEIVDVAAPEDIDGRSLIGLIQGAPLPPLPVFSEALNSNIEQKAVSLDGHKLIVTISPETVHAHGRLHLPPEPLLEVYDLRADPGEQNNLLDGHDTTVMLDALRTHIADAARSEARGELSAETVRQLEAMGYLNPANGQSEP